VRHGAWLKCVALGQEVLLHPAIVIIYERLAELDGLAFPLLPRSLVQSIPCLGIDHIIHGKYVAHRRRENVLVDKYGILADDTDGYTDPANRNYKTSDAHK
jgi:hypothetical protein